MKNRISPFWERLRQFAKGIKLESVSIGPAQIKFMPSEERTSAFTQLRDRVDSTKDRETDVFVLSAHNVDEVTVVNRIDANHECEALEGSHRVAGGSGANTAYALARLGVHVAIAGIVGEDEDGRRLRGELDEVGAETQLLITNPDLPTGRTTTLVERGGNRLIVVFPGINSLFASLAEPDRLRERALSSRVVHLSSFVGTQEFLLQQHLVEQIAAESVVSLTPGAIYARQGLDRLEALLRHVDVLFLYREQLVELVENSSARARFEGGGVVDLMESLFAWRKKNSLRSPVVIVVKDPSESSSGRVSERYLSVGVGSEVLERYIAPQQLPEDVHLETVDTTGTGDAAAAGFLYGLLMSAPLEACVDFGFLMATFASTGLGARTALQSSATIPSLTESKRKSISQVPNVRSSRDT